MGFSDRDEVVRLTPEWTGERFDDGRPRVADDIVERLERCTTEEAWAVVWGKGYRFQFQGGWKVTHPGKVLVGRAVTAVFVPERPDLHNYLMEYGHSQEGRVGMMNSWVIETLQKDDVLVVDLFGKIFQGTFSGGNLSTAIATRTGRGQVIWGGIRDLQQIMGIDNLQTFYLDCDPTGIREVTMIGMNVPTRIGNAICMPGDIVLGTESGIFFIPPQHAEEIVVHSERTRLREIFGLQRLREKVYTSAQMDTKWTEQIEADFARWRKDNTPPEFRHLSWDEETQTDRMNAGEQTLL
ncbi:MAG: RraA family protein [Spirochaetaceae bacterium]|nr:MAG: RraA family protein [Spirochaetaceae bacterium]